MPSRVHQASLRGAVSVSEMASMLRLSRAAFYVHLRKGTFVEPVYSLRTRRPFYTAELQAINLQVRATQVGANGEYAIFYERQEPAPRGRQSATARTVRSGTVASDFRRRLEGLGLVGLTDAQVERAVASCFPLGTTGTDEGDVLRAVYRQLRRSNSS